MAPFPHLTGFPATICESFIRESVAACEVKDLRKGEGVDGLSPRDG